MAEINPRNAPIALILAGAIIISAVVSAYAYGQRADLFLATIVIIAFIIGFTAIVVGATLYYWDRQQHWQDRKEPHA